MRLFNVVGHTEQKAQYRSLPNQPYVSWKGENNIKTIVISKSVKNDLPENTNECRNNCSFIPNPIKHYRKQYVSTNTIDTGYSNLSYIGNLDKPGAFSITSMTCNDSSFNQLGYEYFLYNNTQKCKENGQCLIIKSANSIIKDDYCVSSKELLWKKCKTFNQNLPSTQSNLINPDCTQTNNCNSIFVPSNQSFQTQGSVSSSTRIASLKYKCNDPSNRRCFIRSTDYNNNNNLSAISNSLCCSNNITKRRSNIYIMK